MSNQSIDAGTNGATAGDLAGAAAGAAAEYAAEVRFGIVMYGGVSLAIYINGVTNEIFEMACATPREGVAIDATDEPFTRSIYRRLSWLVGNDDLRRCYADAIGDARAAASGTDPADAWSDAWIAADTTDYSRTRFAVDVVAGTSAGGINGIFLAKALANGERFAALKDLWINEGDISLLLNDEKSYLGTQPAIAPRDAKPTSLLNSDRMYAKLHYALGQMKPLTGVVRRDDVADGDSPLVDEIDLYITTTDIKGSAVPLRLFDKVVYERRYKQNYHFRYPNGITPPSGNDFDAVNRSFLAFAARCTSSFPFAFEPMTLAALTRLDVAGAAPGVLRWNPFFPNLSQSEVAKGEHVHRAFGDGGYLDNKPFSYVVDTLSRRFASVPLERKLVFVEPSPERLAIDEPPDPDHPPDALQNSLAALTSIPQYETIREDLQAVLARNRRIERIERVVRLGEDDVNVDDPFSIAVGAAGVPAWASLKLSDMVKYYGTAFLPYQRLRVYAVTDALADRLGEAWGIDRESDQQYALRAVVRVWRERTFDDEGRDGKRTINAFLDEFDLDYRVRRLGFLLRKVDKLTRLFHKRGAGVLDVQSATATTPTALSEEELQILHALPPPFTDLPASLSTDRIRDGERILRTLKKGLLGARARMLKVARDLDLAPPVDGGGAMRADLDTVLLQILGRTPAGATPEIRADDGHGRTTVVLDAASSRMASASRTLQEAVVFRASALFDAAGKAAATPLQKALIEGLEAMRVKRSSLDPDGPQPALDAVSGLAWHLLGKPTLVAVAVARDETDAETRTAVDPEAAVERVVEPDVRVEVQVDDANVDAFGPTLLAALPALDTADGAVLRKFLGLYYLRFDTFDQMSFPLYYDTGTGEPSTVEVVRVSPVDATNLIDEENDALGRKKLAGTALANFGAFLDRRWRLNDIMWGQLDGAERLIEALLPMTDRWTQVVRKELIERAHRSILRAALVPEGQATLAGLVIKALDESPSDGPKSEQLRGLFDQLWKGNTVARDSMAGVLVSLLSEPGLMAFVRDTRKTDPAPDPELTLKSAARAVTITGRVLEVIGKQHNVGNVVPRWLARLGLMMQGIVAVSLPGTLNQRWWTHGVKVLYAFEAILLAAAFVFGNADMRSLAVTTFATTIGIHLLTLIAGDLARESGRVFRLVMMGFVLVLVILAGVGALTLVHRGVEEQLCRTRSGQSDAGASGWVCDRIGTLQRWWYDDDRAPGDAK